MNVYWDCYQGYSLQNDKDERARFTFTEIEKAYYVEKYSDHVDGQNISRNLTDGMVPMFIYWTGLCILMKQHHIFMNGMYLML